MDTSENEISTERLANLLFQKSSLSPEEVESAQKTLKETIYCHPDGFVALFKVFIEHDDPHIKSLSSVEILRLIPRYYPVGHKSVPKSQMDEFKSSILNTAINNTSEKVYRAAARVITMLARVDLYENTWQDLVPTLCEQPQNGSLYVLYELLDPLSSTSQLIGRNSSLKEPILTAIYRGLDHESLFDRVISARILFSFSLYLSSKTDDYSRFVPKIRSLLLVCVSESQKNALIIIYHLKQLLLSRDRLNIKGVVEIMFILLEDFGMHLDLSVGGSVKPIPSEIRAAAMSCVYEASTHRDEIVEENEFILLTKKLMEVVNYPPNNDPFQVLNNTLNDYSTPKEYALLSLVSFSFNIDEETLPQRSVLPSFTYSLDEYPSFLSKEAGTLLTYVTRKFYDQNHTDKLISLFGITTLCHVAGPKIGDAHRTLVPLIYNNLDTGFSWQSQGLAYYHSLLALVMLFPNIDPEVFNREYLAGLCSRLLVYESYISHLNILLFNTAAKHAGPKFAPYLQKSMEKLFNYAEMSLEDDLDDADFKIISVAHDTIINVSWAVHPSTFEPYLDKFMESVLGYFESKEEILVQTMPIYIARVAEFHGHKMGKYMERLAKPVFEYLDKAISSESQINCLKLLADLWLYVPFDPYMAKLASDSRAVFEKFNYHESAEFRSVGSVGLSRMSFVANKKGDGVAFITPVPI